jgi:sporulation protein YtfJ
MSNHAIEVLVETAMNSINEMVDVNTIIGEPIETKNGMVIIPISKVCFGFAAGGSEFKGETIDEYKRKEKEEEVQYRLPFGGGSGAGVSINPVAFVVVQKETIKVLPIEHTSAIDKLMDYVPDLLEKANLVLDKKLKKVNEKIEESANNYQNDIEKIDSPNADLEEKKVKLKSSKIVKNKKTNLSDDDSEENE